MPPSEPSPHTACAPGSEGLKGVGAGPAAGDRVGAEGRFRAWEDETPEPEPRPWSAAEVAGLVARYPSLSPWRVLGVQVLAGVLVAALGWLLTRRPGVAASALYGAAAVVLPGLMLVRAMGRRPASVAAAQMRFLVWAFVKLGLAVAMLAAASRTVPDLSWPALLVAMVVCLKVYALALLWQRRQK